MTRADQSRTLLRTVPDVRGIMFDLDGTLVDSAPDICTAINAMRAERDLPSVNVGGIIGALGAGSEALVRGILVHDVPPEELDAATHDGLASYMSHYERVNGDQSSIYPGVLEGLQALAVAGIPMACVTNKPQTLSVQLLKRLGLAGYFDLILGGDALPRKKPDPLPLLTVALHWAMPIGDLLMIGDSEFDVQAARRAGCPVWVVPYGYHHQLDRVDPDLDRDPALDLGHDEILEPVRSLNADGIVSTIAVAARYFTDRSARPPGPKLPSRPA